MNDSELADPELGRIRMRALEAKANMGGHLSREERLEWWQIHGLNIAEEVDALVRRKKLSSAFSRIIREMALISVAQSENREKLEVRVAALEPKPRIRVKAIQRVIA